MGALSYISPRVYTGWTSALGSMAASNEALAPRKVIKRF